MEQDFIRYDLNENHYMLSGYVPHELQVAGNVFEEMWALHPSDYHEITMHGRKVKTPRWQQAYGMDYHYTGRVNHALPVPALLQPYLLWTQQTIDPRLNGILLNWYDGRLGHYIGKHRDSTKNMQPESPIVTISFGEERTFRLRPWKGEGYQDFMTYPGRVFVMPYATNLAWTHEIPASQGAVGRRISLTFRAFQEE